MEHPRNLSPLHKTLKISIHPCDQLHVTVNLQKDSADDLWLPGMSVFSVNGPPLPVSRTAAQPEAACSNYSMSTNLPIRARVAPDHRLISHGNGLTEEISPEVVIAYMRQSGASEESISHAYSNPALLDYNCQMMRLRQLNQRRLGMARTQLPAINEAFPPARHAKSYALQDYKTQLRLLEQQNKERLIMARQEQESQNSVQPYLLSSSNDREVKREALPEPNSAYEMQQKQLKAMNQRQKEVIGSGRTETAPWSETTLKHDRTKHESNPHLSGPYVHTADAPTCFNTSSRDHEPSATSSTEKGSRSYTPPAHQLWLSGPHALQDYQSQMLLIEQQNNSQSPAFRPHALQNYQMQLMLLDQESKRRKMRQDAAKAKEDAELAHKNQKSILDTQSHGSQLAAEHFQPESHANRYPPAQQQAIIKNAQKFQQIFCPCCRQMKMKCAEGRQTCQICARHNLPCHDLAKNQISFVGEPIGDRPVPGQRWDNNGPEISLSAASSDSAPLMTEQIAAQKQAMIERHQKNMDAWQRIQQQNHHSPHYSENALSPSPNNRANQLSKDTSGFHNDGGWPMETCAADEHFVVDLPMRPSKQVAEQADSQMDEWSEVERPHERACSEESEQFTEDFHHDFSI